MAKVKVHNKGKKIVVIDGVQLLPNDTKEIEDTVLKIPAVKSLINRGFIELASRGNGNGGNTNTGNGKNNGGNTGNNGKGETPNGETGSETPTDGNK